MMVCNECGRIFDEGDARMVRGDMVEHFGTPCRLPDYAVCPSCKSEDIEQAYACEGCGETHSELYYADLSATGDGDLHVCKDCRVQVLKRFDRWKVLLTETERKILKDAFAESEAF